MNPERWQRIDALLSAALERSDEERSSFLAAACEGDDELRAEVQRLLGAHQAASSFLESTPSDAAEALGPAAATWTDPSRQGNTAGRPPNTPHTALAVDLPVAQGSTLGRYIILNRLGRGGMGIVYAAYDPQLDRKVALKLMRAEVAGRDAHSRLLREAQAMARLSHPNVIAVHDVGTLGEQVFIAMEFIDGCTLTRWLREKQRSPGEIVQVFVQAGRGLAAAHSAGLVHRDFKPDNVLLGKDAQIKVLDFGLARAVEDLLGTAPTVPPSFDESPSTPRALSEPLTRSGVFLGTPAYMAPEQLLGKPTDARADQFSFCVALHEALYGERPFAGDSVEDLKQQVTTGRIKEPARASRVPASVREVLRRGLRTVASERFSSMEALLRDLAKDPRATRRRALTLGAIAIGLAAVAVGYREQSRRASRVCKGAEGQLAGVWDDARRNAVASAFTGTGKPFAADAIRSVQQVLDAYGRSWVQMHTEACESTRVRGEQSEELLDLRMACLEDRRRELRSLVEIFSRGDASVVEKAPQAALGLAPLSGCADAVALKAPVPLPADPSVRAQADEVRQKLAQARALEVAGKYGEGLPIAGDAVARSRQLRYRPVEAEALGQLGMLQYRAGDFKSADDTFHQSVLAALAGRHDEALARAWIALVAVGHERNQYERAHEAGRSAAALLERFQGAEELRARLSHNLGRLLDREGRYAEALEHHRAAMKLLEETLGPEHADFAESLNGAAIALTHLGQYDEAIETYQRASTIKEKLYGQHHPSAVPSASNLGIVYAKQGKYELAHAQHRRALHLAETLLGPQHPWVVSILINLSSPLARLGRYDEALTELRRALTIAEKLYGPEHSEVLNILNNIGGTLLNAEQYPAALENLQRALSVGEKVKGPDSPELAYTLLNLGVVLCERDQKGDFETAEAYLRRALALRQKAAGPESPEVAPVFSALAHVLKAREPKKALEYLEQSLQIREKHLPADSPLIPSTLTDMGDVYLNLGKPLEAKGVLERALQLFASSTGDSVGPGRTKFLLARALWDARSDRDHAVVLCQQAREDLGKAGKGSTKLYREMEAWLSTHVPNRAR